MAEPQNEPNTQTGGETVTIEEYNKMVKRAHNLEASLKAQKNSNEPQQVEPSIDTSKFVSKEAYDKLHGEIEELKNSQKTQSVSSQIKSQAKTDGIELTDNDLKFIVTKDADKAKVNYEYIKSLKADKKPDKPAPKDTKHEPKKNIGELLGKQNKSHDLTNWL